MKKTRLNILIRKETQEDIDAVYQIVKLAFEKMVLASGDE
jgi:hypothetical protein